MHHRFLQPVGLRLYYYHMLPDTRNLTLIVWLWALYESRTHLIKLKISLELKKCLKGMLISEG